MLPLNLSHTAATSQDISSQEFIAAIVDRQCYIEDASGRGLCFPSPSHVGKTEDGPLMSPTNNVATVSSFFSFFSRSHIFLFKYKKKQILNMFEPNQLGLERLTRPGLGIK